MYILPHFTLTLLKLEHALITADLLNQNLTKKAMLLHKNCFNYLRPSFLLRHLNLATLANFWKLLNLSCAKIKISLFFSFFDQTGNW